MGITGASGSVYAKKLIETLAKDHMLHLVITKNGEEVFEYEIGKSFRRFVAELPYGHCHIEEIDNMFSILASGSSDLDGMLIVPCTMGTIGKINAGTSDNLLIRSADVMMKEGKPLVIVPRETPFSTLHLRNLHSLSSLGVKIVPPIPSFYDKPNTIDDLVGQSVGRIIKAMGVSNELYNRWSGGND